MNKIESFGETNGNDIPIDVLRSDPRFNEAFNRGEEAKKLLVEKIEGGMKKLLELSEFTNLKPEELIKLEETNQILSVHYQGETYYPVWQFKKKVVLPDLPEVIEALCKETQSNWTKAFWLVSRNIMLGNKRPLDLLRAKDGKQRQKNLKEILASARMIFEMGQ